MTAQDEVALISLAGIALVAFAFLYVALHAGERGEAERLGQRAYALRRWWFAALVLTGVGVTWASLAQYPIADQHAATSAPQVVNAVGRQWSWELTPQRVRAGVPVEFRVSSADVNHGFAIYGPDERIVTQTQSMPGYTNRLVHTFAVPGHYRVLCLEYCGLAHHAMAAGFDVVAKEAQP
jgi:cytochrome c oxidase subunit 2